MEHIIKGLYRLAAQGDLRGYKVMRVEGDKLVSGANSRLVLPLKEGERIQFPKPGIWLSLDRQYVLDYYSGLAEQEALLTVLFSPEDVAQGNLTDRETEFAVTKGYLEKIELL